MNFQKLITCLVTLALVTAQAEESKRTLTLPEKLWGWADLHAHPASHLSFGNDANGKGGIFWGRPGLDSQNGEDDLDLELPACSFKHGGADGDLIRHETHKGLMAQLDAVTEYPHQTADFGENNHGSPSFKHWPHARSITHQQMHITQVRRAYEGGQRLMIASVTNNELLSHLWTKIGYNAGGNPVPSPAPMFGYLSAVRQIDYIKKMAKANPEWMEVAYSAADARRIIKADKLALILSVEMDTLEPIELVSLVSSFGVRHVIPVHLVDNRFGGTAVYNDAFNALNNFFHSTRNGGQLNNDGFFKIVVDEKLDFELGRPSYLRPEGFNFVTGGAIYIDPVPMDIWNKLRHNSSGTGYQDGSGHRNARGLTDAGEDMMAWLAKQGVLIDVAHMSQRSVADTLSLARKWDYPVMDSHTGIREEGGRGHSERHLHPAHAQQIGDLGGVIGLGTDWDGGLVQVLDEKNMQIHLGKSGQINYGDQDPYSHAFTMKAVAGNPEIAHIEFRIKTGGDSLNKDLNAVFKFDGKEHKFLLNKYHEGWREELVTTSVVTLPAGTTANEIRKFELEVQPGAWWALDELRVRVVPRGADPVRTWLEAFKDTLKIMDGKGMALGTDINGFAPQLWLAAEEVDYPVQVARKFGRPKAPVLAQDRLGARTFSFKKDGIAHYGMLPDFIQALSEQPESAGAVQALFHSANDVVLMWEKCEEKKKEID